MAFIRVTSFCAAVCLVALLAACSPESGSSLPPASANVAAGDGRFANLNRARPAVDPNDPYGRDFEEAISGSDSNFVKQVLSDHKITDAEFSEAQDRYEKCLNDAGIETARVSVAHAPSTMKEIAIVGDSTDNPAVRECRRKWIEGIDLYSSILYNPQNVYWFELIARCLVDNGVAPKGLTAADVEEASAKTGVWNENGKEYPPIDPDPILPGGTRWSDPQVRKCDADPLNPESVELYVP